MLSESHTLPDVRTIPQLHHNLTKNKLHPSPHADNLNYLTLQTVNVNHHNSIKGQDCFYQIIHSVIFYLTPIITLITRKIIPIPTMPTIPGQSPHIMPNQRQKCDHHRAREKQKLITLMTLAEITCITIIIMETRTGKTSSCLHHHHHIRVRVIKPFISSQIVMVNG